MRVMYLSSSGGFADYLDLDKCMTIEEFFAHYVPNGDEADYQIRVNGLPISRDYLLKNNDRITIIALEDLATL